MLFGGVSIIRPLYFGVYISRGRLGLRVTGWQFTVRVLGLFEGSGFKDQSS